MTDTKFACPHCQQHLEAPEEVLGQTMNCPTGQGQITLPKQTPPPPPIRVSVAQPQPVTAATLFFATSKTKLVVMSLCTFGIYDVYWFYKNWKFVKEAEQLQIQPFWRAFFAFFFCNGIFKNVQQYAMRSDVPANYSPGWLTFAFIAINIMWRLPDPVWLVSCLAFLPLLPVQGVINAINAKQHPTHRINDRFTGWNIAGIVFGVIWFALVIIGMTMPQ